MRPPPLRIRRREVFEWPLLGLYYGYFLLLCWVNNGSLTVVDGSTVPGGLADKWFNYKASLNADTLEVKIYINNCLKSTYKGGGGDGHFYFKNGVYFCKTSAKGCFSHYKNIHLYTK